MGPRGVTVRRRPPTPSEQAELTALVAPAPARAPEVVELEAGVTRAVRLGPFVWLLDVGGGWWLWIDALDLPAVPRASVRWSRGWRCRLSGTGDAVPTRDVPAPPLPPAHPMAGRDGPAAFRGGDDPVAALAAFPDGRVLDAAGAWVEP